jgi:hypothetical protein
MPETQPIVCDECKVRPATVFITQIIGGVSQKLYLCRTCSAAKQDPQQQAIEQALQKGCAYCGAPAVGAGGHGTQGPVATCGECAGAAYEFMLEALGFDRNKILTAMRLILARKSTPLPNLAKCRPKRKQRVFGR